MGNSNKKKKRFVISLMLRGPNDNANDLTLWRTYSRDEAIGAAVIQSLNNRPDYAIVCVNSMKIM